MLNWHIPPRLQVHALTHGPSYPLSSQCTGYLADAAGPLPSLQTSAAFAFHPCCPVVQHGDRVTPQVAADVTLLMPIENTHCVIWSGSIRACVFVLPGDAHLWC